MASYFDALFGHFNEEVQGGIVYGGENPDEEERDPATEKEAGEAFDKMMGNASQEADRLFNSIWKGDFTK